MIFSICSYCQLKNNALSVGLSKQTTVGICFFVNVSKMGHICMVSFLQGHHNYQKTTRHCFSKQHSIQEYFLFKFRCTIEYLRHQRGLLISDKNTTAVPMFMIIMFCLSQCKRVMHYRDPCHRDKLSGFGYKEKQFVTG